MPRDIKKAIAAYQKIAKTEAFCYSDIMQLDEISRGSDYRFDIISNSLRAGYVIGYRAAERKKASANECKSTEA